MPVDCDLGNYSRRSPARGGDNRAVYDEHLMLLAARSCPRTACAAPAPLEPIRGIPPHLELPAWPSSASPYTLSTTIAQLTSEPGLGLFSAFVPAGTRRRSKRMIPNKEDIVSSLSVLKLLLLIPLRQAASQSRRPDRQFRLGPPGFNFTFGKGPVRNTHDKGRK